MVELGSNDGETLLEFIRFCPDYKAAYCFEPGKICIPRLNAIANSPTGKGRIHIIPKGAWSSSTTLKFAVEDDIPQSAHVLADDETAYDLIETAAVDDTVPEPVSYMKMDIEGAEMQALYGAREQIRKNKPQLAICVYHRMEDFLDIWHYLMELVPEYRFYLRHHNMSAGTETVLYAMTGR